MYERSYGHQYHEVPQYASAAEIAKAMRADIKQAKSEGLLPAHWKYSVRSENYSGGCAINITVSGPREEIMVEEDASKCPRFGAAGVIACEGRGRHYSRNCAGAQRLTSEAEAVEMTLTRIHGAYNHDGSESQVDYFDVRYYGTVEFAYELWSVAR